MLHDHVPGLSAHIDTDGFRLAEFEEEGEGEDYANINTTRYVEAVPGSSFTVTVNFGDGFLYPADDVECLMFLDGQRVSGKIHLSRRGAFGSIEFKGRSETTAAGTYLRRFQFSELSTHDGSVNSELKEQLQQLGTITVKLVRCKHRSTSAATARANMKHIGEGSIPEKGLKGRAISTQATLGAPEKIPSRRFYNADYLWGKHPFAEFTFKYRSHKDLQIEGIISRSPTPPPLEERDPATLNADELRQLLERRNQELKELSHIKKEKRERSISIGGDDDDGEVIVTERRSKRHRTSQDSGVEVVDLTDD